MRTLSIVRRPAAVAVALLALLAAFTVAVQVQPVAASATTESLWSITATPATVTDPDTASVEIGVRFHATVAGTVTGIRFYKGPKNTGTHTGSLWDSSGKRLAEVTFTNETATGWQSATFAQPVQVAADKTYTASYFAPNSHYSVTDQYFRSAHTAGDLVAPKDTSSSPNGVYSYGRKSAYPTDTYESSNYWVDVVFQAGAVSPPSSTTDTTTLASTTVPTTTRTTTTTLAPTTTAPPSTSTTAPTSTTPIPTSWPTAATTGATGSLTTVNGDIVLDKSQTYQNMRVDGTVAVTACGVTLNNVEVDTGEPLTGDATPDLFGIWLQVPENCGTTLDHVSVLVHDPANPYATEGVRNAYGSSMTVTASKIVGTQLGMTVGPGTVSDSYIALASTMRGDHNEDILDDGITGLTLDHNTFLNPNDQTSALSLFTEFGPNSNVLVENNLLAGGGYTCYCGDGASDNDGNPARSVNVSFINNVFWRLYYPNVGAFGPGRAYNPAGGGKWAGNVYMNTDGTLATTVVPQPPLDQ